MPTIQGGYRTFCVKKIVSGYSGYLQLIEYPSLISNRDNLSTDVGTITRSRGGGGHSHAGAALLIKIEILVLPLSELYALRAGSRALGPTGRKLGQVRDEVKRLNVEHRTSNIERRILMTLRFIYLKTSDSR